MGGSLRLLMSISGPVIVGAGERTGGVVTGLLGLPALPGVEADGGVIDCSGLPVALAAADAARLGTVGFSVLADATAGAGGFVTCADAAAGAVGAVGLEVVAGRLVGVGAGFGSGFVVTAVTGAAARPASVCGKKRSVTTLTSAVVGRGGKTGSTTSSCLPVGLGNSCACGGAVVDCGKAAPCVPDVVGCPLALPAPLLGMVAGLGGVCRLVVGGGGAVRWLPVPLLCAGGVVAPLSASGAAPVGGAACASLMLSRIFTMGGMEEIVCATFSPMRVASRPVRRRFFVPVPTVSTRLPA